MPRIRVEMSSRDLAGLLTEWYDCYTFDERQAVLEGLRGEKYASVEEGLSADQIENIEGLVMYLEDFGYKVGDIIGLFGHEAPDEDEPDYGPDDIGRRAPTDGYFMA